MAPSDELLSECLRQQDKEEQEQTLWQHFYQIPNKNIVRVQKSIFGRVTLIVNHSFHASGHAVHQFFILLLGDFVPLLAQQFKHVSLVWWLVTIRLPFDHIPEVFQWGSGENLTSSEKFILLQSSMVQPLWSFANLSVALLRLSLMTGFFLALHYLSAASRSLFGTVLALHFTLAAICFSLCRSLYVIQWLLSDIQISWQSCQVSGESFSPSAGL